MAIRVDRDGYRRILGVCGGAQGRQGRLERVLSASEAAWFTSNERFQPRSQREGEAGIADAKGDPCPGKLGGGGAQGAGSGSGIQGDAAAEGLGLGGGCHRGDADMLPIPPGALDTDSDEQSPGTDHAGDPEADTRSGSVSSRQLIDHAMCSQVEAHCRNAVGNPEVSPDG